MRHVLALAALLGSSGCTLFIDSSAEQCGSNDDCAAFPGTICSEENVCVAGGIPCATTQECIGKLGEHHVCRDGSKTCVSLTSPECPTVEGDYANEDAFIFGSVLPTQGPDAATGQPIENSIRLAIREFQQTSNGLPPLPGASGAPRPLVLVGCNDSASVDGSIAAARHLADVGVPALIGATFSGLTINMATEVTIPRGMLAISPSATSVAITDLADGGLVWRTSPSDVFQAAALALYVPELEQDVRTQLMLPPSSKVKIAILHKGDAYGSGLGRAIEKTLVMNGAPALDPSNDSSYERFDYGDPDNPEQNAPKYEAAVAEALALAPHILLILGTTEAVTDVMTPVEQGWTQGAYRPRYVFGDGGVVNALWQFVGTNAELRRRVSGSVPGTTNLLFDAFRAEYNTQFNDGTSPDIFGAAGGYDATYLLAYSATALGETPISGAALAEALKKMIPPGPQVDVGTEEINGTLPALQAGGSIDFNGASGPLDFDPVTGEAPSDIQIWCLPSDDGGNATSAVGSGRYFDATTGELTGIAGAICD